MLAREYGLETVTNDGIRDLIIGREEEENGISIEELEDWEEHLDAPKEKERGVEVQIVPGGSVKVIITDNIKHFPVDDNVLVKACNIIDHDWKRSVFYGEFK